MALADWRKALEHMSEARLIRCYEGQWGYELKRHTPPPGFTRADWMAFLNAIVDEFDNRGLKVPDLEHHE
jgi:hypothetical protein